MKTYMTHKENDEIKSKQLSWYYSSLQNISELYPSVSSIIIKYNQIYRSAFGTDKKESILNFGSSERNFFLIKCLNRECTSIGFDLGNIISNMVQSKEVEKDGDMDCKGSESPDHLYQSCGSSLHYSIKIVYK